MTNAILALFYLTVAIVVAYGLALLSLPRQRPAVHRVVIAWWLITAFTFISVHPVMWLGLCAITLAALNPKEYSDRLMFYCALLPAAPLYFGWVINLGSLFLFRLQYPHIITLVLLVPLLFVKIESSIDSSKWQKHALVAALAYVALTAMLDFRETSFTNGLRYAIGHIISLALIIAVFSKARHFSDAAEKIVLGIFLGGTLLVFIGVMQEFLGWLIYPAAHDSLEVGQMHYQDWMEWRSNSLRIPGTMNAIPFGTYMAICLMIAVYYSNRKITSGWCWAFVVMFGYGVLRSDSRGAMLIVLFGAVAYFCLFSPKIGLRRLTKFGIMAFLILFLTTDIGSFFADADEHGTLDYRFELIANSMDSITSHPFFGTPLYLENPQLQASYQGQGIIDIVNSYLAVLLRYGAVSLILYLMALRSAIRYSQKSRAALLVQGRVDEERFVRLTATLLCAFALMIVNVSLVDRMAQYYWILIFLCCGIPANAGMLDEKKRAPRMGAARTATSLNR